MRHAIWVLVLAAACTDEVSITSGVCGNYVLEPGEDCDRPGGACTSDCRIACDPQQRSASCASADAIDGTCCPTGSICGVDAVCHTPTGTVSPAEIAVPGFEGFAWQTADINGDSIADVLSVGVTSTQVLYGDRATPLTSQIKLRSPQVESRAQVGLGDFTGDGRPDIIIPTSTGLFAFRTDSGAPEAVQFPATATAGIVHERVFAVAIPIFGGVALELDHVPDHGATQSNYQLQLVTTPSAGVLFSAFYAPLDAQPSLCNITVDLPAAAVLRGRAIHPFSDHLTVRVPLVIGDSAVGICVATANPDVTGVGASYAVPKAVWTANGYHPVAGDGETFFSNLLSSSGCPDLVVPAADGMGNPFTMILKGVGTPNTDACSVNMLPAGAIFLQGRPLAAITLQALGTTPGLITSAGVYAQFVAGATPVTMSTRGWRYAAVGDLDGDGRQDFVTVAAGSDVEVFRQLPWLVNPLWNDLVIPTDNTVTQVALGNFDGDKAGDVAISTIDPSVANGPTELSIAWGSVDGTFELDDIGSFADATSLSAVDLLDTSLPAGLDHCDDVLIARGGSTFAAGDPGLLIAEYGSTSRVMSAPFIFTSTFGGSTSERGAGVVALPGGFGASNTLGAFALFDVAVASTPTNTPPTSTLIAGANLTDVSYGGFAPAAAMPDMSCSSAVGFCVPTAHYARMTRSSGDLFYGLRGEISTDTSECLGYYIAGAAPKLTIVSCAAAAPAASTATDPDTQAAYAALVGMPFLHPIDNDGTTERLLIPSQPTPTQQAFVWNLTVANGQPQLTSPIALDSELQASGLLGAGEAAGCFDATAIELGTREVEGTSYGADATELVVACNVGGVTELFARYTGPPGSPPLYALLWNTHAAWSPHLRSGDVNGDGLSDVLFTENVTAKKLHVLLQCDTHQTGCIGGGS